MTRPHHAAAPSVFMNPASSASRSAADAGAGARLPRPPSPRPLAGWVWVSPRPPRSPRALRVSVLARGSGATHTPAPAPVPRRGTRSALVLPPLPLPLPPPRRASSDCPAFALAPDFFFPSRSRSRSRGRDGASSLIVMVWPGARQRQLAGVTHPSSWRRQTGSARRARAPAPRTRACTRPWTGRRGRTLRARQRACPLLTGDSDSRGLTNVRSSRASEPPLVPRRAPRPPRSPRRRRASQLTRISGPSTIVPACANTLCASVMSGGGRAHLELVRGHLVVHARHLDARRRRDGHGVARAVTSTHAERGAGARRPAATATGPRPRALERVVHPPLLGRARRGALRSVSVLVFVPGIVPGIVLRSDAANERGLADSGARGLTAYGASLPRCGRRRSARSAPVPPPPPPPPRPVLVRGFGFGWRFGIMSSRARSMSIVPVCRCV